MWGSGTFKEKGKIQTSDLILLMVQKWLVVFFYPSIYRALYIPGGCLGFLQYFEYSRGCFISHSFQGDKREMILHDAMIYHI